jgi:hypothetical protein
MGISKSLSRDYLRNWPQLMVAINKLARLCFNRNECKRRQGSGVRVGDRAGQQVEGGIRLDPVKGKLAPL